MTNIKDKRIKKGLTQAQLAEKVGLKQSTVANYEAGTRNPRIPHLILIAEVLGCSIDELLVDKTA